MGNKLVKAFATNEPIEVVEEVEALFICDLAVNILGVYVVVADNELGVFMVLAKLLNSILFDKVLVDAKYHWGPQGLTEAFPADDGGKVKFGLAADSSNNTAFQVDRPALIQPAAKKS